MGNDNKFSGFSVATKDLRKARRYFEFKFN